MITQKIKDKTLADNSELVTQIADYKALATAHGLPITSDVATLETALRGQLFQKLLTADKGLQTRFNMLKTDDARIKMINDTVNIDGYEQVGEMQAALAVIEKGFNRVWYGINHLRNTVKFSQFVDNWEMDLDKVLSSMVFDWSENRVVLNYFKSLEPTLTTLREVFRASMHNDYRLHETLTLLSHFYTAASETGDIEADEATVMTLAKELADANAFNLISTTK